MQACVADLEEVLRGAGRERAVLDLGLLGEIVGRLDGREHALHREEGGQVGRVGRNKNEREEPPGAAHNATRQRSTSTAAVRSQPWPAKAGQRHKNIHNSSRKNIFCF